MSKNSVVGQHRLTLHMRNMEAKVSRDASEKKATLGKGAAADNVEEDNVKDDGLELDSKLPSGGLKAWLYVLTAFLMLISAW